MAFQNWYERLFGSKEDPTIAQEAGLPDNWRPVDSAPIVPAATAPSPNAMASRFAGSISPTLQHDAIFVGTEYGSPIIPKLPLMPISPSGAPSVGAAVQSGSSTTIVNSVNAVAAGPNGAIQFNSGGALAGSALLKWDNVNFIVTVGGSVNITGSLVISGTITASVFNATTGFEIGGTAGSGKYLRGNGTNFVSATLSGSDILAGLVNLQFGGTDADLSGTGGAHQVLRQSSVGAAITVSQLSFSDISGTLVNTPIWNTTVKSGNYTAIAGDMVLANTTGGGFTVTLPASASNTNLSIRVKKTSSDANTVTVGVTGGDLIDGASTQTFTSQYTDLEVTSDGAGNWWID